MSKYLDADGVKYLWQKLSLEDYPNNEVLSAVINAIDESIQELSEKIKGLPRVFFTADLTNQTTKEDVRDGVMEYEHDGIIDTYYCTMKLQGTSSLSYPKKNYTIKLFEDADHTSKAKIEAKTGWGKQNKYCFKANYIDHTHARNIICARLWAQAIASRTGVNEKLLAAPNKGVIDGFHIKVYINGIYQGLYTWNIPKDGWMTNMDDEANEAILCAEIHTGAGSFSAEAAIDGTDWSLEYPDELPSGVLTGFNNLINFIKTSTDEEFKANFSTYADVGSFIDYYLLCYYFCALDNLGKNMIVLTYDNGATWIANPYDMDSTWGAYWDGASMVDPTYQCPEDYECSTSLLWQRLEECFSEELYNRYTELTTSVWSLSNIITTIENFYNIPNDELYEEDVSIYSGIPTACTLPLMRSFMANRKVYVDAEIKNLYLSAFIDAIYLSASSAEIPVGYSLYIKTTFDQADVSPSLTISSSDDSVAIVEKDSSNHYVIHALSSGSATITFVLNDIAATLEVTTTDTISKFTAPVALWTSNNYTAQSTTWTDSINNIDMTLSAGVDKDSMGRMLFTNTYDTAVSSTSADISSLNLGTGECAIEFEGLINASEFGLNIISLSPDDTYTWANLLGLWTATAQQLYGEILSSRTNYFSIPSSTQYSHIIIMRDSSGLWSIAYNTDLTINTISESSASTSFSVNYIGFHENTRWFNGALSKIAVYNYCPTTAQIQSMLGFDSIITAYYPLTYSELSSMASGDSKTVILLNPHATQGYFLGYDGTSVISAPALSLGTNQTDSTSNEAAADYVSNSSYYFTLTKTDSGWYLKTTTGDYSPLNSSSSVSWITSSTEEFTITNATSLGSTSMCAVNPTNNPSLVRISHNSQYLNAGGAPASLKYASGLGEWSVWYMYEAVTTS